MLPTSNSQSKGFKVSIGSEITPADLAKAGISMQNFQFYPACIEQVKASLWKQFAAGNSKNNYVVTDESTLTQRIYRFQACPF